ncbi:hypothetical protein [Halorussus halobius]|uniref:hypothetical protein n=1 Tax=Halorussus halobius TaxID=1710537 RepID=UPI001092ED12|nr:hypothetical protein [Halorussus halobius]
MADDTYTHRPGEVAEERGGRADEDATDGEIADGDAPNQREPEATVDPAAPVERGREEWSWRDWILVGVVVLCFLVVPAAILILPPVRPFRFAYLVLPLIPAFLLGAVAVWSAQRST